MSSDWSWLPPMAVVSPWTEGTYDMLYGIFRRDFVTTRPRYCGREVWHFPEMEDGKEALFWHLTSREVKPKAVPRRMRRVLPMPAEEPGRYPDLRRCERLPWVRPMIENSQSEGVLAWDYLEGSSSTHTYVWLRELGFVTIMKKYADGARRLVTSFYVDKDYKRRDFERKYSNRLS